jgi:hypothetical protein
MPFMRRIPSPAIFILNRRNNLSESDARKSATAESDESDCSCQISIQRLVQQQYIEFVHYFYNNYF